MYFTVRLINLKSTDPRVLAVIIAADVAAVTSPLWYNEETLELIQQDFPRVSYRKASRRLKVTAFQV